MNTSIPYLETAEIIRSGKAMLLYDIAQLWAKLELYYVKILEKKLYWTSQLSKLKKKKQNLVNRKLSSYWELKPYDPYVEF